MSPQIRTIVLLIGFALTTAGLTITLQERPIPGYQQGYEPVQPIAFSHQLHAGELQIDCRYCHNSVETSRHAGFPSTSTCMNCHQFVTAPFAAVRAEDERAREAGRPAAPVVSEELAKLYAYAGFDVDGAAEAADEPRPLDWVRVHNLPDHVHFDHSAHVTAGLDCRECHGPVEQMVRVRQDQPLSMSWCLDCHGTPAGAAGIAGSPQGPMSCTACHH